MAKEIFIMILSSVLSVTSGNTDILNEALSTELSTNEVPYVEMVSTETIEEVLEPTIIQEVITTPEPTITPNPVSTAIPYYIKVNKSQNVVNIYTIDNEGKYTIPYKAMLCSTGTSTPKTGSKYKITSYRQRWNGLKGGVYGQYAVQITGNILFHSVPYTKKNTSSLEYWEYDKLGTKASMGCIRLTVQDAKWIYDNVVPGTWVEFYEDDNAGPLGKPEAKIISDNELCRNWDPTDMVDGNPWNEYVELVDDSLAENIYINPEFEEEINEINKLYEELINYYE